MYKKAPGSDGINIELTEVCSNCATLRIRRSAKYMLEDWIYMPEELSVVIVIPIYKKGNRKLKMIEVSSELCAACNVCAKVVSRTVYNK
jgi:hypothetical protein